MFNLNIKTIAVAGVFAAAASLQGGMAHAASCGTGGDTSDVTINSIDGGMVAGMDADSCVGINGGNDDVTDYNAGDLHAGYTDDSWALFGKSDDGMASVTADQGQATGSFTVNFSPVEYSVFAVVLKASTGWISYLFDFSPETIGSAGGSFTMMIDNGGGNIADLSHASVYTYGAGCDPAVEICGPPVGEVPVPTSLPLLATGLIGMGLVMRRRRKAA